jgi:DNA-binding CsgD family transcriptional regulator
MRGKQHFCQLFKDWWCVAGPIKDIRGETLGYLDISMHTIKELGTTAAMLKTLLGSIEKESMFLDAIWVKNKKSYETFLNLLSLREKEILEYLVSQASAREIATTLYLSPHPVKTYRKRIYKKLGVKSLLELINKASL